MDEPPIASSSDDGHASATDPVDNDASPDNYQPIVANRLSYIGQKQASSYLEVNAQLSGLNDSHFTLPDNSASDILPNEIHKGIGDNGMHSPINLRPSQQYSNFEKSPGIAQILRPIWYSGRPSLTPNDVTTPSNSYYLNTPDVSNFRNSKGKKSPRENSYSENYSSYLTPGYSKKRSKLSKASSNNIQIVQKPYYATLAERLRRRISLRIEPPSEFDDDNNMIDSQAAVPQQDRLATLNIVEMNALEQLYAYHDKYPLLKLRKTLLYIPKCISVACAHIIVHPIFEIVILLVIIWNSIALALDKPGSGDSMVPPSFDTIFLVLYTVEMAIKIFGLGFVLNRGSYLRDAWNVLDFIIVVTAYIPLVVSSNSVDLRALRSFRVLRPLKTISRIKELKVIMIALFRTLPLLRDTLLILMFLFMVFAIAGLQLYMGILKRRCYDPVTGKAFVDEEGETVLCGSLTCSPGYVCGKMIVNPNYDAMSFDTIFWSFLMVFQIVTMEGWTDIMYSLQKTFTTIIAAYFLILIFIGTFFLLNLTLAVIKTVFTDSQNINKIKSLTYNEKLQCRIDLSKEKVVRMLNSYKRGEVTFNKCQILKSGEVRYVGPRLKRGSSDQLANPKRRKSVAEFFSQLRKKTFSRESFLFRKISKKAVAPLQRRRAWQQVASPEPNESGFNSANVIHQNDDNLFSAQLQRSKPRAQSRKVFPIIHQDTQEDSCSASIAPISATYSAQRNHNTKPLIIDSEYGAPQASSNIVSPTESYQRLLLNTPKELITLSTTVTPRINYRGDKLGQGSFGNDELNTPLRKLSDEIMASVKEESMEQSYFRSSIKKISRHASRMSSNSKDNQSAIKKVRLTVVRSKDKKPSSRKPPRDLSAPIRPVSSQDFLGKPPLSRLSPSLLSENAGRNLPLVGIAGVSRRLNRSPQQSEHTHFPFKESDLLIENLGGETVETLVIPVKPRARSQQPSFFSAANSNLGLNKKRARLHSARRNSPINEDDSFKLSSDEEEEDSKALPEQDKNYEHSITDLQSKALLDDSDFVTKPQERNHISNSSKPRHSSKKNSDKKKARNSLRRDSDSRANITASRLGLTPSIYKSINKSQFEDNFVRRTRPAYCHATFIAKEAQVLDFKQEAVSEPEKFVIDLRYMKVVPVHNKEYESSAFDDVVPSERIRKLKKEQKDQWDLIHNTKLPMIYIPEKPKKGSEFEEEGKTPGSSSLSYAHIRRRRQNSRDRSASRTGTELAAVGIPSGTGSEITNQHSIQRRRSTLRQYTRRESSSIYGDDHSSNASQILQRNAEGAEIELVEGGSVGAVTRQLTTASRKPKFKPLTMGQLDANMEPEFEITYSSVKEKILEGFPDQDEETLNTKEMAFIDETKYMDLRKRDLQARKIFTRNFSALDVMKFRFDLRQLNTIRFAMMPFPREYNIWFPGFAGLVKGFRHKMHSMVESAIFNNGILVCVFLNTLILALDGVSTSATVAELFSDANLLFTIVFTIEMAGKLIGIGIKEYVRDIMNVFDCIVVILSLVEVSFMDKSGKSSFSAFRTIRIFRTFRVLRVTRLLRSLAFMKVVIGVISRSIRSIIYIMILLFLMLFIYSLLGMQLFGGKFDMEDMAGRQNFDNFFNAFLSTFQIMTVENWPDILQNALRTDVNKFFTAIYMISWIFIGNYIFINLLLAILLEEFTNDATRKDQKAIENDIYGDNDADDDQLAFYHLSRLGISLGGGGSGNSSFQTSGSNVMSGRRISTLGAVYNSQGSLSRAATLLKLEEENQKLEDADDAIGSVHEDLDSGKPVKKRKTMRELYKGVGCEASLCFLKKRNPLRVLCMRIVKHSHFESFILAMIILSSLKLAIETYFDKSDTLATNIMDYFDYVFTGFFALEALLKIIAYGLLIESGTYLREPWNILDFAIVVASLVDLALTTINIPFIRILRLLRTLRPLRFISHNENMRIVVSALLQSVGAIINVLIVVFLVWLMFAILASNLLKDKLGYCNVPVSISYYGISKTQCIELQYQWQVKPMNYDNVGNSLLTMFVLSTLEDWPDILADAMDAADATQGPIYNGYKAISLFFIVFIFIGSYFLMNLFIGVIFLRFTENQKEARKQGRMKGVILTDSQQKWVEMQRMITMIKPTLRSAKPKNKFRLIFYRIIMWGKDGLYFDLAIMAMIVANIFTMSLSYEGSPPAYDARLTAINYFFTGVFIFEAVAKILGLGIQRYWMNTWNKFDAFVVLASLLDILMSIIGNRLLSFLRVGPQLARVIRVLRVSRLLKLVKSFKGLQQILQTLIFSLPSLMNVLTLLFLVYFIYSVLAVFIFSEITAGAIIGPYVNFTNFGQAIITLFRCSTGEDWWYIMYDTLHPTGCKDGTTSCGQAWAPLFWLSFILIAQFIMLNLFILVVLQEFENYYLNPNNPMQNFKEDVEKFKSVWLEFTEKYEAIMIKDSTLVRFFSRLEEPLGFIQEGKKLTTHQMAKEVMKMNLKTNNDGFVFFNDVLFGALKRAYGDEIFREATYAILEYVRSEELKTIKVLKRLKTQVFVTSTRSNKSAGKLSVNPMIRLLFLAMTFRSWHKYATKVDQKQKECDEMGIDYESSEESDQESDSGSGSEYSSDSEENSDSESHSSKSSSSSAKESKESSPNDSNNSSNDSVQPEPFQSDEPFQPDGPLQIEEHIPQLRVTLSSPHKREPSRSRINSEDRPDSYLHIHTSSEEPNQVLSRSRQRIQVTKSGSVSEVDELINSIASPMGSHRFFEASRENYSTRNLIRNENTGGSLSALNDSHDKHTLLKRENVLFTRKKDAYISIPAQSQASLNE